MPPSAVLICNGPSAMGYAPPEGAYVLCLNDGFMRHKADAVFTSDCEVPQNAWLAFDGKRIQAAHNPCYATPDRKRDELFECRAAIKKYRSSAAAALAWLVKQKFARCAIAGMDAASGSGKPGARYTTAGHREMLREFASQFPQGLFLVCDGVEVAVDETFLATLVVATPAAAEARPSAQSAPAGRRPGAPPPAPPANLPQCRIPQTLVEVDASPFCTRKCGFCAPGIPPARRRQKRQLSEATHEQLLSGLAAAGFDRPDRWLVYCGHGEPLLNPGLLAMLRAARRRLPRTRLALYTNGDPLDRDICCALEALDLDVLVWDCYDEASALAVPRVVASSSLDPARVRVNDYRAGHPGPTSRCSTVKAGQPAAWRGKPCAMPGGKLFFTDDGKDGGRWLLCCECYDRAQGWPGSLSPLELNADEGFVAIRDSLARGGRDCCAACRACDRDGTHVEGFGHVPALVGSPFWPARRPNPPACIGRRLVILPVSAARKDHARLLLDAIDRLSTMPGETLVLWNDDREKNCPDELRGERRIVWEEPRALGWCGIARGIGRGLKFALDQGYDYVLKLDTDAVPLIPGWDAALCAACPPDGQTGTIMDGEFTGQVPEASLRWGGLFVDKLSACRWARGILAQRRRRWDHVQGGCYAVGRGALARLEELCGLEAPDQEDLAEDDRVGEDVYLDTKVKVCGIPQIDSPRFRIWFRHTRGVALNLEAVRYQRDVLGAAVVHPVKDLELMAAICGEAG